MTSQDFQDLFDKDKSDLIHHSILPTGICLLKVNNRNIKTRCEIFLKLAIETPERR